MSEKKSLLILGAGPAGLTAGFEAINIPNTKVTIIEATNEIGGISRTVERNGFRFDLGGHRFFTKVKRVENFWNLILEKDEFLDRPRMSRIFYDGKLFDYPLRPVNALKGLGIIKALRCVLSYFWVRVKKPKNQDNFENWVAARFGWHLYRIFFKTYTEKVWGIDAKLISSDWASQRIKNLSLFNALLDAFGFKKKGEVITTLIDSFSYPKYGPGMMWQRCAEKFQNLGGSLYLNTKAEAIFHKDLGIEVKFSNGRIEFFDYAISSIPLSELPVLLGCKESKIIGESAAIKHRDFLTVALVVEETGIFPDNWIYIHSPNVKVGRVQNYGSWSPYMVKPGFTCLGLEYFVNENDEFWNLSDEKIIEIAIAELLHLKLIQEKPIVDAHVIKVVKAYPVYDQSYKNSVSAISEWLSREWPQCLTVGRNGMHRYNNQDHSMLTAMLAVENLLQNKNHDLWSVNVEKEYHEEKKEVIINERLQPTFLKKK